MRWKAKKLSDCCTSIADGDHQAPPKVDFSQGDTHWMPFTNFSDADLYRKLLQYQQGLEHYCIEKIGEKVFDELMKK